MVLPDGGYAAAEFSWVGACLFRYDGDLKEARQGLAGPGWKGVDGRESRGRGGGLAWVGWVPDGVGFGVVLLEPVAALPGAEDVEGGGEGIGQGGGRGDDGDGGARFDGAAGSGV